MLQDSRLSREGRVGQLKRMLEILADKRANLERQLEDIRAMQRERDQVEARCQSALGELKESERS